MATSTRSHFFALALALKLEALALMRNGALVCGDRIKKRLEKFETTLFNTT